MVTIGAKPIPAQSLLNEPIAPMAVVIDPMLLLLQLLNVLQLRLLLFSFQMFDQFFWMDGLGDKVEYITFFFSPAQNIRDA
jgi:hypothetical protein